MLGLLTSGADAYTINPAYAYSLLTIDFLKGLAGGY